MKNNRGRVNNIYIEIEEAKRKEGMVKFLINIYFKNKQGKKNTWQIDLIKLYRENLPYKGSPNQLSTFKDIFLIHQGIDQGVNDHILKIFLDHYSKDGYTPTAFYKAVYFYKKDVKALMGEVFKRAFEDLKELMSEKAHKESDKKRLKNPERAHGQALAIKKTFEMLDLIHEKLPRD